MRLPAGWRREQHPPRPKEHRLTYLGTYRAHRVYIGFLWAHTSAVWCIEIRDESGRWVEDLTADSERHSATVAARFIDGYVNPTRHASHHS